jgi:glycosyltransferase involved in cell wall biosynthesis
VVTTTLGVEGIGATHLKDAYVGNIPETLAGGIVDLLGNPSLYKRIQQNGRKLIEKKYTWNTIAKDLEEVYKKTVAKRL